MTAVHTTRSARLVAVISIAVLGSAGMIILFSRLLHAEPPAATQVGYPLNNASASDVVSRLRTVLPSDAGPVQLAVDRPNNRVLVKGTDKAQKLAAEFVAALDQPSIHPLTSNTAAATSVVKAYPVPADQLDALSEALQRKYPATTGVRVVPDSRTGQLLIVGPADVQRAIQQQINNGQFNVEPSVTTQSAPLPAQTDRFDTTGQFRLRNITWQELEAGLRDFLRKPPATISSSDGHQLLITLPGQAHQNVQLQVDRRNGMAVLRGPARPVEGWLDVVKALDSPQATPNHQTRLVSLRNAKQASVKRALSILQDGPPAAAGSAVGVTRLRPTVRGDAPAEQLVSRLFQADVSGAPADKAATEQASPAPPAGQDTTATIPLAPGTDEGLAAGGLIGQVQIEYLEGSDVIVIRGHERDVQRVIEIINQIEDFSRETEPEIKVLPLKNVDSVSMETLVTELYEEAYASRQGPVSITALGKPNALLLIGRPETVSVVVKLVEHLDQPVDPETQFSVFQLEHISATEAQTMITEFFDDATQPSEDSDRGGLGTKVRITADARSNSLIVQASPRDLAEVQRLVKQIDVSTSKAVNRIEIFQLQNSRADELAPILQQAVLGAQGQATGGGGGPLPGQIVPTDPGGGGGASQSGQTRSAMLTFLSVDPEGGESQMLRSGIMRDVLINADTSTNSLIVTAPEEAMGLIAALVRRLDQVPSSEAVIKVFTLAKGDASDVREMLEEVFAEATGQQQTQVLQTAAGQGETSLVPLRFSVDVRTNSIVATGTPEDLQLVWAIILKLDGDDALREKKKNIVYHLRYTQAADVAAAIQDFLQAEQQRTQQQIQQLTQGQQGLSPFEQIEREVVVVAEALSNTLIISATPRFYDQILDIITDIDAIPPMVMIQVLIAEVGCNEDEEFGIEWGVQDSILFDRGSILGAPGLIDQDDITTGAQVGTQGLTDLSMGRQNSELGYGGFVFAAGSESLNILLRALQQRLRTELLARPQIMALDNQAARIQLGEDVRLVSGTSITDTGLTNLTTEERSVGVILDVLPRISPDGTVTMLISAERSRLGDEAEGTPIGFDSSGLVLESPNVELATALTTISVRSGQTAVFAGLITNDDFVVSRRVPFLADIPIMGNAFRYDSAESRKTELLIMLTPHVVRSAEDIERIKSIEAARMSWCMADVISAHGDPGIAGKPSAWHSSEIITEYPDGQPTLAEPVHELEIDSSEPIIRMPKLPGNPLSSFMRRLTHGRPGVRDGENRDKGQLLASQRQTTDTQPASSTRVVATAHAVPYRPMGDQPSPLMENALDRNGGNKQRQIRSTLTSTPTESLQPSRQTSDTTRSTPQLSRLPEVP